MQVRKNGAKEICWKCLKDIRKNAKTKKSENYRNKKYVDKTENLKKREKGETGKS